MKRKINFLSLCIFFFFLWNSQSEANFKEKLVENYKTINTLSFDFTQQIGEKIEFGNCLIKYPLQMKCEYPRRKKIIIANGKKLAIVKKKYKKIYHYSLKKTPLFFLLSKEKILNLLINNEPAKIEANIVEYELFSNRSELKIFFDKNSSELLGWRTKDAYSNEVIFLIRNIKKNLLLKNKIFKIPKEENL